MGTPPNPHALRSRGVGHAVVEYPSACMIVSMGSPGGLLGEPPFVNPLVLKEFLASEEQVDLAFRARRGIGAVDQVPADRQPEIPADRPWLRFRGVRRSHHLPDD